MPTERTPTAGGIVGDIPASSMLMCIIEELRPEEGLAIWRELATILDADSTLDGLDAHDRRHAVAAVGVGLVGYVRTDGTEVEGCPDTLRRKADWIESTADGAEPLHDPAAVARGLRRVADLCDLPW